MAFLTPYMLWGALAASIPIALHFFYRSRYQKLPWAAMKFLLASIEQTSRRLRFQELLLLLCRVAVLVLLALALARPSSMAGKGTGRGDAVDAVFVFDTSLSMQAHEGPQTRLELAKKAARSVMDQLPAHSTVQIITCSDRTPEQPLGPRIPGNFDQAKEIIAAIPASSQASDLLPGVKQAAAVLQRGHAPNKEVYFFSDMQKLAWDQQAAALDKELQETGKQATVYLVRCGSKEPRNVSLVDIVPQSGIPHTGERAAFAVLVRNNGKEPARNLQVSLTVDGSKKSRETQPVTEIAPGATRAVPVSVKLDQTGLRILSAEVQADELDADNRLDRVIYVRDQVRVLVVDGAPDERDPDKSPSFFLMHALAPVRENDRGKYHVQAKMIPAAQASAALLANQDVVVLANVALQSGGPRKVGTLTPEFLRQLTTSVRAGRGLIVFGGDNVQVDAYNRVLYDRYKLLPGKLGKLLEAPPDKPLHLDRATFASPFFWKFRDDEHYQGINKVEVVRALGLEPLTDVKAADPKAKDAREAKDARTGAEPTSIVLRYSNGQPAIVSHRVGNGEVMLVTTTADPRWTDWPLRYGLYVPFLDVAMSHLLHGQTQNHNGKAGEPLRYQPAEADASRAFVLVQPDGKRVRLGQPTTDKGRLLLTANDTPLAGVYRILAADDAPDAPGVPFAAGPDLRETENLEGLTNAEIDQRLGFPVIHLSASDNTAVTAGAERQKREWTMWFLAAVLGLALVETGLAWLCGRSW